MANLTIVAHIRVKVDKIDFMKTELTKLVAPTLAEDGCICYTLHQDNGDPSYFMFYEQWETREKWLAHNESEHIKAHRIAREGCLESFGLSEMTQVA